MPDRRIVVVGTTPDYVSIIRHRFPQRAIFLNDSASVHWVGREQFVVDEVHSDLSDRDGALVELKTYFAANGMIASGIACFDCESLSLAAYLAEKLDLPYPSTHAVAVCRNKYETHKAWYEAGLLCPRAALVSSESEAVDFHESTGYPSVIKPLTGSGSELVLKCDESSDCSSAFSLMRERLAEHSDRRMYSDSSPEQISPGPRRAFMIEEYIRGDEYSCDFVIDGDSIHLIRIARKIISPDQIFGTTTGYVIPADIPGGIDRAGFLHQLHTAVQATGLARSICMLDFIVRDGEVVLIELSPRPGGDCLPELLLASGGFDTIGFALDFAEGKQVAFPDPATWTPLVGLRLIADRNGTIAELDHYSILQDNRVLEYGFKHGIGHRVCLPPDDYDSRILGHVIFRPRSLNSVACECGEIAAKLTVKMEEEQWKTPKAS
ncbi:MAG: ATP-grasp domain-containing protein [Candidatus Zixiibacteriota bacterium]